MTRRMMMSRLLTYYRMDNCLIPAVYVPVTVCGLLYQDNEQGEATILVVQDNLVKGASGQAVQSMNVMFGFDETCGLELVPVVP